VVGSVPSFWGLRGGGGKSTLRQRFMRQTKGKPGGLKHLNRLNHGKKRGGPKETRGPELRSRKVRFLLGKSSPTNASKKPSPTLQATGEKGTQTNEMFTGKTLSLKEAPTKEQKEEQITRGGSDGFNEEEWKRTGERSVSAKERNVAHP